LLVVSRKDAALGGDRFLGAYCEGSFSLEKQKLLGKNDG